MTKNFKKNGGGSKAGTPQTNKTQKVTTPKQTPKSETKKSNVKFDDQSDNDLTVADLEAVMNTNSGKKKTEKATKAATPVQNNKPNKKNTPTPNQKQTTPASNKNNNKKRQRESDDDDDEEAKSPVEKKKLIFSPEAKAPAKGSQNKTPVSQSKAPAAQNKTPNSEAKKGKPVAAPVSAKKDKETPLKSILKKRGRDESDDEEEEVVKKAKVEASPKKAKAAESKKAAEPKKVAEEKPETEEDIYRKTMEDRNSRMLLIKNVNKKVTESDIKKLSNDIIDVTVKVYYRAQAEDGKKVKKSYGNAYLLFKDQATAEANMKALKDAQLKGEKFILDYVGLKSEHDKKKVGDLKLDPKRLFVTGFNKDTVTVEKLQAVFPSGIQVSLPKTKSSNKSKGYAFVSFADEATCKSVLKEAKSVDDRPLTFTYAKVLNLRNPKSDLVKSDSQLQKQAKKKAKKGKQEVTEKEGSQVADKEEKVPVIDATKQKAEPVKAKSKKELAKAKKEELLKKMMEEEEEDDDDDDDIDDSDDDDDDEEDDDDDDDEDDDDDDDDDDEDDDDDDDDDDE